MDDDIPARHFLDWLRENRFFRQHPGLCGLLTGFGLFVLMLFMLPPLWWLLSWLFGPLLTLIGQALVWWYHLWGPRP